MVSALDSVVLSVCRISGGTNSNIIPGSVELQGTVRYLKPETGERIPQLMEQITAGVCDSMGATYDFTYSTPYIPTINSGEIVALGERIATNVLGPPFWIELEEPAMAAEDFSFYIKDYPGAMFRLGMGEDSPSLHHPSFDFNDGALRNGILFLTSAALEVLSQ